MKTVLISGVSTGIGRATANHLLEKGWRVYGSVRKPEDAAELAASFPQSFHGLVFDVTDTEARRRGVATIQSNGHALHALVNNAGIAVSGPLERIAEADYRKQFEVNVFGMIGLTQDCLPLLHAAQDSGVSPVRIINISSVSGLLTSPFTAIYSASKFAVESLTDGFRRELLPFGIDVVSIAPGPVKTPIWDKAVGGAEVYENSRYAFILEKLPAYLANAKASAIPAEDIATRVYEVLEAAKPNPYHLLMQKAWLIKLLSLLPKPRIDKLFWKNLNANQRY
jgi:NAD(P)-dependent dehydrogenase (short-subunit alcohol dehydrogenase family)